MGFKVQVENAWRRSTNRPKLLERSSEGYQMSKIIEIQKMSFRKTQGPGWVWSRIKILLDTAVETVITRIVLNSCISAEHVGTRL